MKNDHDKLWFQTAVNQNAIQRAEEAILREGRALPCKVTAVLNGGSIVTVSFEVQNSDFALPSITIPKLESPYFREPVQIGDMGMTIPSDVFLGGISGIGSGVATLRKMPNLAALAFVPVSNANSPSPYPGFAVQQGPSGFVCQTLDGNTSIMGNESGITMTAGGKTWTFTASGLTMSTGIVAETHVHADPQGGTVGTPEA